jgi:mono/diheme cytochrome c family protein
MMRFAFAGHVAVVVATLCAGAIVAQSPPVSLGDERAVRRHLASEQEFNLPIPELVEFGRTLFVANWTVDDGAGRPLSKGTGKALLNSAAALRGERAFNRISGPAAMSCAACHRHPAGIAGGGGDFVSNVFEGAERFDFVTFDREDHQVTGGAFDESGTPVSLQAIGNLRSTPSLFGAGYLEMLARQITADLQRIRDSLQAGQETPLVANGISFGTLARRTDGRWDTSAVEGLPPQSLESSSPRGPSLAVRPWQQSGTAVSLREFVNTSYNQHIGIQTVERFGLNADPDGDTVINEMTRGDVTAVAAFIATLPVPERVVPGNQEVANDIAAGESAFERIGCSSCHVPSLPLQRSWWTYSEPGPHNQSGTLQVESARRVLRVDLTSSRLPHPRLIPSGDVVRVPAFTDFKLHDITDSADATMKEPLDLNQPATSPRFRQGNRRFLTRRLWDVGSRAQFFHDGRFTTIRDAVLAHSGEALAQRRAFERLSFNERRSVLLFLASLQAPALAAGQDRHRHP